MLEKYHNAAVPAAAANMFDIDGFWAKYEKDMNAYGFHNVIHNIQTLVTACDSTISAQKPWEKVQQGEDIAPLLYQLAEGLRHIALALLPILPGTAESILNQLGIDPATLGPLEAEKQWGGLAEGTTVQKTGILFPRLTS